MYRNKNENIVFLHYLYAFCRTLCAATRSHGVDVWEEFQSWQCAEFELDKIKQMFLLGEKN